jgi:hypothetical protein
MFPISDYSRKRRYVGKIDDQMDMVWHPESQTAKPDACVISVFYRFTDGISDGFTAELVPASRISANCDKIIRLGTDPIWWLVIHALAGRQIHDVVPRLFQHTTAISGATVARRATATFASQTPTADFVPGGFTGELGTAGEFPRPGPAELPADELPCPACPSHQARPGEIKWDE